MPLPTNTVDDNRRQWSDKYPWPKHGDEWSKLWGGSEHHWKNFILPRIRRFLPARTILEIGPGHGRWTQFLADYCEHLIIVDLCPACIEHCRKRFVDRQKLSYFTNDGRSLDMIPDRSIDFAFSFDSLVHVDAETVRAYVNQLPLKLRDGGSAFIHHSNAATYKPLLKVFRWIADRKMGRFSAYVKKRTCSGWRASDLSARLMVDFCRDVGIACAAQEVFAPAVLFPIDCISVINNRPFREVSTPTRIDYVGLARASVSHRTPSPAIGEAAAQGVLYRERGL